MIYSRAYKAVVSVPPLAWVLVLLFVPYALLLLHSFWSVENQNIVHAWGFQNYRTLLAQPMYRSVLTNSLKIAATVTLCVVFLGYPLAYFVSFHCHRHKDLIYRLVIIPLWVSYLVRGYAWKTILGSDGVLNGLLQYLHVTHEPVGFLLYSPFAVIVTLTHIYTPFLFLPVYASLEHIPRPLLEASQDLGARPFRTFWKVIFPLSLPGLISGAVFSFVLTLGDFLAPLLVGGPSGIMISNVVVSLFGAAYNWPLGAAIALCMLLLVLGLLRALDWTEKHYGVKPA
jgi:spermidine/putrescine transport system permease protein